MLVAIAHSHIVSLSTVGTENGTVVRNGIDKNGKRNIVSHERKKQIFFASILHSL